MLNNVVFQKFHFAKTRDLEKSKRFITEFFLRAVGSKTGRLKPHHQKGLVSMNFSFASSSSL